MATLTKSAVQQGRISIQIKRCVTVLIYVETKLHMFQIIIKRKERMELGTGERNHVT